MRMEPALPFRSSWVLLLFALLTPCLADNSRESAHDFYQSPGTLRMARRLAEVTKKMDPGKGPFLSIERAALFRQALLQKPALEKWLDLMPRYATELLNAGQTDEAFRTFAKLEKTAQQNAVSWLADNRPRLGTYQALVQLRRGEQENCITMHNEDSCIFPIQGGGIHRKPQGSRNAVEALKVLLRDFPEDLQARWLLTIATMTLGEYPDKVPPEWLIPPSVFKSEHELSRFRNVAPGLGLDSNGLSGGAILEDFDNDGFLDVMFSSIGFQDPLQFFHNNGDGTFTDKSDSAGLRGETGGLNLLQADYNNDGYIDVLVLRGAWFGSEGHHPNSLLRNNGNGTFDDVTDESGMLSFHPTQTAVWLDFNGDGWLDLFIGNESTPGDENPCELFRSNRNGTFTDVAVEAGLAVKAFVKGVTAGDFDNDGRPDLYLSVRDAGNFLFHNDGPRQGSTSGQGAWSFTDVTAKAGVREPIHSFPTWFFDYDNDGWLDLFVAGYKIRNVGDVAADYLGLPHSGERARLYRNHRDGTFEDVSRETGTFRLLHAMGSNFGDLDNDGWLDMYLGTGDPDLATLIPNVALRNNQGRRFQDVTTSTGLGHLQKGHGVAFGDIDNDGDQDILEDMGGAYAGDLAHNVLFKNPGNRHHWVTLKLEGVESPRCAIGARIQITLETAEGTRDVYRTVGSGGSFGASPLRAEIGLGDAKRISKVQIRWPAGGGIQQVNGLALDGFYQIREGEPAARPWGVKSFKLPGD